MIPLCPEAISKEDGQKKNDCELNAAKRLIKQLAKDHPKLPMIIVEDALYANGPHLALLKEQNMRYIIGVKPADHRLLFEWVDHPTTEVTCDEIQDPKTGVTHRFRYVNGVPLNQAHLETPVNFLVFL